MSAPAVRRSVYLHIGVPKSGTTFVRATLKQNRTALHEAGFLYPDGGEERMFRAALDVRGNHKSWGRRRSEVEGTWDGLCHKARRHEGTTIIGHELLAAASARQIDGALAMLTGLDLHIVVTARDLGRQVTAEWQEGVKHGRSAGFRKFSTRVLSDHGDHAHAQRFWAAQDLPDLLGRWGSRLPPENVHVVCCPPPDADPDLLWRRFADAIGFDPGTLAAPGHGSSNSSLGVVQIDLLRQVNAALDGRLVQPEYGRVVKHYFTKQLLAQHRSGRPELPIEMYDELGSVGERWVKEIDRAGYTVHGDLTELVPTRPPKPVLHPDDVDTKAEVTTAAAVVADLLVEVNRLRSEVAGLESDKKSLRRKRKLLKRRLANVT